MYFLLLIIVCLYTNRYQLFVHNVVQKYVVVEKVNCATRIGISYLTCFGTLYMTILTVSTVNFLVRTRILVDNIIIFSACNNTVEGGRVTNA